MKIKRLFLLLVVWIAVLICSVLQAQVFESPNEGIRQLGMGDASIGLADDAQMLWNNPAGLAYVDGIHFNLFDFGVGADSTDTLSRIQHAIFNGDVKHLIRPDRETLRFQFDPTLIVPYFGLSVFENAQGLFDVGNLLQDGIQGYGNNDLGVMAGFAIPFTRYFSFGASLRAFERTALNVNLSPTDLLNMFGADPSAFLNDIYGTLKGQAGTGYGFGLNFGSLLRFPLENGRQVVSFAATAENVGETSFRTLSSGSPLPPGIRPSYNFGTALTSHLSSHFTWNNALDLRDEFRSIPFYLQLHYGTELRFPGFGLRGGIYQGYPTFGFSIETPPHTRIYFSSYAVELGNKLWQKPERWYLLQLVIGFNPI